MNLFPQDGDHMKLSKGCVQVYTGDGKGKTTAAMGLGLRAAGQGLRVRAFQFMKKDRDSGELKASERLHPNFTIVQLGRESFVNPNSPDPKDVQLAQDGIEQVRIAMDSGAADVIILDEINVAMSFKLVTPEEVLSLINAKPDNVELILTGRGAPDEILERADLVTEMREVKHYYNQGVPARDGIER